MAVETYYVRVDLCQILHWVKKKQLHTTNCCDQRTSYQRTERLLIVDYGRPPRRAYHETMSARYITIAAAALLCAGALLYTIDYKFSVPTHSSSVFRVR